MRREEMTERFAGELRANYFGRKASNERVNNLALALNGARRDDSKRFARTCDRKSN
ncbi:hypothetical protein [Cellulosilyticum sp. I15G10I2]|uniref:hypothetical protein n=1 Tax=Cellulosilyticum sp. I15G10I2 TaxID=1892843 RepID=UPI001495BB3F|nr:hypothetical protein [Cellulosilyticum sp. I15G10I2]